MTSGAAPRSGAQWGAVWGVRVAQNEDGSELSDDGRPIDWRAGLQGAGPGGGSQAVAAHRLPPSPNRAFVGAPPTLVLPTPTCPGSRQITKEIERIGSWMHEVVPSKGGTRDMLASPASSPQSSHRAHSARAPEVRAFPAPTEGPTCDMLVWSPPRLAWWKGGWRGCGPQDSGAYSWCMYPGSVPPSHVLEEGLFQTWSDPGGGWMSKLQPSCLGPTPSPFFAQCLGLGPSAPHPLPRTTSTSAPRHAACGLHAEVHGGGSSGSAVALGWLPQSRHLVSERPREYQEGGRSGKCAWCVEWPLLSCMYVGTRHPLCFLSHSDPGDPRFSRNTGPEGRWGPQPGKGVWVPVHVASLQLGISTYTCTSLPSCRLQGGLSLQGE